MNHLRRAFGGRGSSGESGRGGDNRRRGHDHRSGSASGSTSTSQQAATLTQDLDEILTTSRSLLISTANYMDPIDSSTRAPASVLARRTIARESALAALIPRAVRHLDRRAAHIRPQLNSANNLTNPTPEQGSTFLAIQTGGSTDDLVRHLQETPGFLDACLVSAEAALPALLAHASARAGSEALGHVLHAHRTMSVSGVLQGAAQRLRQLALEGMDVMSGSNASNDLGARFARAILDSNQASTDGSGAGFEMVSAAYDYNDGYENAETTNETTLAPLPVNEDWSTQQLRELEQLGSDWASTQPLDSFQYGGNTDTGASPPTLDGIHRAMRRRKDITAKYHELIPGTAARDAALSLDEVTFVHAGKQVEDKLGNLLIALQSVERLDYATQSRVQALQAGYDAVQSEYVPGGDAEAGNQKWNAQQLEYAAMDDLMYAVQELVDVASSVRMVDQADWGVIAASEGEEGW